ncbi:MAG TPA: AzlD domain-containing protein [Anaerolineales bacterium]
MTMWLVMLAAGLLTYLTRLSFIMLWGKINIPIWLLRSLRFVPPAVFTAIIFPELFLPQATLDISLGNARLIAGILAALVAWKTRNIVLTILVGMSVLLLIQYFV